MCPTTKSSKPLAERVIFLFLEIEIDPPLFFFKEVGFPYEEFLFECPRFRTKGARLTL